MALAPRTRTRLEHFAIEIPFDRKGASPPEPYFRMIMTCSSLASAVGCVTLLFIAFTILKFVWEAFLRPPKNPARWGAQMGAWALITGAGSGVGRGFALELARKGFSLMLVGRSEGTISETVNEVKKRNPSANIDVHICDFSLPRESWLEGLRNFIGERDIGLLVNNVGVNTKLPDPFHLQDVAEVDNMLAVNTQATVAVTRLVLPGMLRHKRGGIVMLSSYTGSYPCPTMAVYSATKAFIDAFATALSQEVRGSGVDVLTIRPFYVVSNMSGFRKASFMVRSSQGEARDALRYLGYTPRAQPYWVHRALEVVFWAMPLGSMLRMTHRWMVSTRARIIASQERYAKKLAAQKAPQAGSVPQAAAGAH